METLLVTKNNIAYSATTAAGTADSLLLKQNLETLKDGSIVFFQEDGTRQPAAGTTKTENYGYFIVGMPTVNESRKSPRINCSTLSYEKLVYVPAVAQVTIMGDDAVTDRTSGAFAAGDVGTEFVVTVASTGAADFRATATALLQNVVTGVALAADTEITLGQKFVVIAAGTPDAWGGATLVSTLAGTLSVGTKAVGATYGIKVIDLNKETWEKRVYDISTTLADATRTTALMLDDIVALVNSHPKASLLLTAARISTASGISFTGVTAGEKFQILPQGLFYSTTVTNDNSGTSIAPVAGQGTAAQITELERLCNTVEGSTGTFINNQLGTIWNVPSMVTSASYTVYVLTWMDYREVGYPSQNANPNHKTLNIAIPSGDSTMIAAMDAILTVLIA